MSGSEVWSLILSSISLLIAMATVLIAFLNRNDSIRPHIYVYLDDMRDDEGNISDGYIVIENLGKYPARMNNIEAKGKTRIFVNNKQYGFEQIGDTPGNYYIDLEKVLKNKLKGISILPGKEERVFISLNEPAISNIGIEKLDSYLEVLPYTVKSLKDKGEKYIIIVEYTKVKRLLIKVRGFNFYKDSFDI
ncbi:hypothetical protein WN59_06765 [Salinicoccus sediminis]|uniref:Uncharacterized protein n=1 Tax=Salinicoccus sediminis TaxID=1432562 RepID=A0A0M2SQ41_9STAP|nr:hypothetical protein [Salinicoccus sediminis]KKK34725.1 hypothetical protein WN59_06765 [Salinicoccus sediminis]